MRNALILLAPAALLLGLLQGARGLVIFGLTDLIVFFGLWVYAGLVSRGLEVERSVPVRALEDQKIVVHLLLSNRTPLLAVAPSVEDFFPVDKSPRKEILALPGLLGREAARLSYHGLCYSGRGSFLLDQLCLVARDPLGAFERRRRLPESAEILVYPRAATLPRCPWRELAPAAGLGQHSLRAKGRSALTLGLREYRSGDPLRFIHWPSTARRGRLVVREFDRPTLNRSAIFLALDSTAARGLGRHSTLELAVRAAAALSRRSLERGEAVDLFLRGAEERRLTGLASLAELPRVLEQLALLRPDPQADLWALVEAEEGALRLGTTVILLIPSSEGREREIFHGCARLCLRGRRLVVLLVDASQLPPLHQRCRSREAERSALLALIDRLLGLGIPVGRLLPQGDLMAAFAHPLPPRIRLKTRPKRLPS